MISSAVSAEVLLAQRLADLDALRLQEGVGHAAADDQLVDLADQVAQQVELGRDLGAADHGADRPLGIAQRLVERLELGLHQPAGERPAGDWRGLRSRHARDAPPRRRR